MPSSVSKWWLVNWGNNVKGSRVSNIFTINCSCLKLFSRMAISARRQMVTTPLEGASRPPLSLTEMSVFGLNAVLKISVQVVQRSFSCKDRTIHTRNILDNIIHEFG